MKTILLILLLCKIPFSAPIEKQVDCNLIEKNNIYDKDGLYTFTQYIYYNWDPELKRNIVIDFVIQETRKFEVIEVNNFFHQKIVKDHKIYKIRAKHFRESWTQFDPEILNKKYLPERLRENFQSYEAPPPKPLPKINN